MKFAELSSGLTTTEWNGLKFYRLDRQADGLKFTFVLFQDCCLPLHWFWKLRIWITIATKHSWNVSEANYRRNSSSINYPSIPLEEKRQVLLYAQLWYDKDKGGVRLRALHEISTSMGLQRWISDHWVPHCTLAGQWSRWSTSVIYRR